MAVYTVENEKFRVVLIPGIEPYLTTTIKSFALPDPRTGRSQGFLLANGSLMEVNRFKQAYNSWLLGDRLLSDGGVFLATVYDPLFVLLPVLDLARDKDESCPLGKFKKLDELLYDGSMPGISELMPYARGGGNADGVASGAIDGVATTMNGTTATANGGSLGGPDEAAMAAALAERKVLERGATEGEEEAHQGEDTGVATNSPLENPRPTLSFLDQQLACICDVRRVDNMAFYRLNEDRVLAWLCCKFRRIQAALAPQLVGMDAPHAAAYVLGFLSEYVNDKWISLVATRLGINEKEAWSAHNTSLKTMDGNAQDTMRPAPPLAGPPEKKQKTDPRVAAKQASLAKQAVGIKKMTSFFSKK
ncbi:hypothetical protein VaNZ11_008811 [Volvox africanus]|uniref:Ribonuclease H2 subunit B n=1 Tax=Volvox africanus TaxID=51714 RepID=A0ABQ5S6K6_9CHLO|nr:hypothetical protein VaNZ11_008811 [Volvox africanus]